jgi:hypothetical protein
MASLEIEVYRNDTDELTAAMIAVVNEAVGKMPYIDRSIIVAAALGNVACHVDAVEFPYKAECTTMLRAIANSWWTIQAGKS